MICVWERERGAESLVWKGMEAKRCQKREDKAAAAAASVNWTDHDKSISFLLLTVLFWGKVG